MVLRDDALMGLERNFSGIILVPVLGGRMASFFVP